MFGEVAGVEGRGEGYVHFKILKYIKVNLMSNWGERRMQGKARTSVCYTV